MKEQPRRSPYGPIMMLIFAAALFVAGGIYLLREPKHTTVEIVPPQPTATDEARCISRIGRKGASGEIPVCRSNGHAIPRRFLCRRTSGK